jgi:hypothetical protein
MDQAPVCVFIVGYGGLSRVLLYVIDLLYRHERQLRTAHEIVNIKQKQSDINSVLFNLMYYLNICLI